MRAADGLPSTGTPSFWQQFWGLPKGIQGIARDLYRQFLENPRAPSLRIHALTDTHRGRHRKMSYAVSITLRYRAIYVVDNGPDGKGEPQYCWYWIGSHEDYNSFTGLK